MWKAGWYSSEGFGERPTVRFVYPHVTCHMSLRDRGLKRADETALATSAPHSRTIL